MEMQPDESGSQVPQLDLGGAEALAEVLGIAGAGTPYSALERQFVSFAKSQFPWGKRAGERLFYLYLPGVYEMSPTESCTPLEGRRLL